MITANYFFYELAYNASLKSLSITGFPDDFGQNLQSVSSFFEFLAYGANSLRDDAISLYIDDFNEHFCENFTGKANASYFAYYFLDKAKIYQPTAKFFQINDNFFINSYSVDCRKFFNGTLNSTSKTGDDITVNFKVPANFGKNINYQDSLAAFFHFASTTQASFIDGMFASNPKILDFTNCQNLKYLGVINDSLYDSAYYHGWGDNTIKWNGDYSNTDLIEYFSTLDVENESVTINFDPPLTTHLIYSLAPNTYVENGATFDENTSELTIPNKAAARLNITNAFLSSEISTATQFLAHIEYRIDSMWQVSNRFQQIFEIPGYTPNYDLEMFIIQAHNHQCVSFYTNWGDTTYIPNAQNEIGAVYACEVELMQTSSPMYQLRGYKNGELISSTNLGKNPIAPTTELKSLGGRTSDSENRACVDATIILKDCYIQINNQEVWRGATLQ